MKALLDDNQHNFNSNFRAIHPHITVKNKKNQFKCRKLVQLWNKKLTFNYLQRLSILGLTTFKHGFLTKIYRATIRCVNEWPSMNQEQGDEDYDQPMCSMVATNFRRTNNVQQPNPLSQLRSLLRLLPTPNINDNNLCGWRNFVEEETLWKKNLRGRRRMRENVYANCSSFTTGRQLIFWKCSLSFTRVHTTQTKFAISLKSH